MKRIFNATCLLATMILSVSLLPSLGQTPAPQLGKSSLKKVVAAMTVEEYQAVAARREGR